MGKVLSAARWSFQLLAQRIDVLRAKQCDGTRIDQSIFAYDESQMKNSDHAWRQQQAELDYDC